MIEINHEKCTLCEVCVAACPFAALVREGEQIVVLDSCRLCQICVKKCPEQAIFLRKQEREEVVDTSEWRGVMVVAEWTAAGLHPVTFELVGKGRELADQLGEKLYCVVVGEGISSACQEVLEYGVDTCLSYDHPQLRLMRVEPYASAIANAIERVRPGIVLLAATPIGRSLAPRVAVRFRTGLTADCTRLEVRPGGELVQIRPAFGGNIMAQIVTPRHRPQMATVRYKVMERAVPRRMPEAKVEHIQLPPQELKSGVAVISSEKKPPQTSLADAEVVVAAGRGVRSKGDLAMLEELAELLGGQLGVTRPLVEAGWADYTRQIGLSGRTIRPKLLITVGVSGAVQFAAGASGAELIIAINSDPNAPIFNIAHYGLVGDLYPIVEGLIHDLKGGTNHGLCADNIS
ncbi:MAG: electron transfer flavoprotein subunit alpha [Firmicutes bacterium]|jgi:electron transfer flavoprotein alpha subunit|nr:electron transfer flavoprotein subunit alpha [Bacillota bacterium]